MEYKIEVTELHQVKKVYFIDADNKKEAINRAKNNDWDDAYADEPTGIIEKVRIDKIKLNIPIILTKTFGCSEEDLENFYK